MIKRGANFEEKRLGVRVAICAILSSRVGNPAGSLEHRKNRKLDFRSVTDLSLFPFSHWEKGWG